MFDSAESNSANDDSYASQNGAATSIISQDMSEDSFHTVQGPATVPEPPLPDQGDLVTSIKGMYRILDLISEHGSGGLGMVV